MITLEKLTNDLNINQIDEVVGGTNPGGVNTIWDFYTTMGFTSGHPGVTNTTYPGAGD